MADKPKIVVFGGGIIGQRFLTSGDANPYDVVAVLDNNKTGEFAGCPVVPPAQWQQFEFDYLVLALWDKPGVIDAVTQQLLELGVPPEKLRAYSYDRHIICPLEDKQAAVRDVATDAILYAYYDFNGNSETYDITSFLVSADCYRQQQGYQYLHLVLVARDEQWHAQAFYLENQERLWRAENIVRQACNLLPSIIGVTQCATREQAKPYLAQYPSKFPQDYDLDEPQPIFTHKDFYYWLDQGFDPRRLKASDKAKGYVQQWQQANLPQDKQAFLAVTLRETGHQSKRNSNLLAWHTFFAWLAQHCPNLSVVIIRDTEQVMAGDPFGASEFGAALSNVYQFPLAAFHMELRMALYEQAFLNMGVSNGPKQLCHLSQTCAYITMNMLVEGYHGTQVANFEERCIEVGKSFRFAAPNQQIVWQDDSAENLIAMFQQFLQVQPL